MPQNNLMLVKATAMLAPVDLVETELAKDRWDARNIPGLQYAPHTGNYYINFTNVPETFRPVVKSYTKFLLTAGRAALTLDNCAYYLGSFSSFSLDDIQMLVHFKL